MTEMYFNDSQNIELRNPVFVPRKTENIYCLEKVYGVQSHSLIRALYTLTKLLNIALAVIRIIRAQKFHFSVQNFGNC